MNRLTLRRIITIDGWFLFYGLIIMYALYQFLLNNVLFTDYMFVRSYEEILPLSTLTRMLEVRQRFEWIGYLALFITVPLKAGYTAICLNTGLLLAGEDMTYGRVFKSALFGEVVFVVASFIHLSWMVFAVHPETIQELGGYYPLSLMHFFDAETIPGWFQLPLRKINLFEAGYILVISMVVREYLGKKLQRVVPMVAGSYILGVVLIFALIIFMMLQT